MADHPTTLRVAQARRQYRVDALYRRRRASRRELVAGEGDEMLGPDVADARVAEVRPDVLSPRAVDGDRVGAGSRVGLLRREPEVDGLDDRLAGHAVVAGEGTLSSSPRASGWRVGHAPLDLAADQPAAGAGVPLLARVPAALADRGHR
jgi:hypothetical protein